MTGRRHRANDDRAAGGHVACRLMNEHRPARDESDPFDSDAGGVTSSGSAGPAAGDVPRPRPEPTAVPRSATAQDTATAIDIEAPVSTAAGGRSGDPDKPGPADEHGAAVQRWREKSGRRRRPAQKRPWWVEIPVLLVTAFILTFLIQTFLFKVYYVPSGSMEQTLHGVESGGDRILVNKVIYDFSDPEPGDVVVFKGPPTWAEEANIPGPTSWLGKLGQAVGSVIGIAPPNEKDYVKRVIAIGGQTVKCCDAGGNVTVDGVSLDEPYIYEPIPFEPGESDCSDAHLAESSRLHVSERCFGPVQVPSGQVWVMGDHRLRSADSSYHCQHAGDPASCQGPIPVDDVIGKAIFIIMPISRWDTIGDPQIDHRGG